VDLEIDATRIYRGSGIKVVELIILPLSLPGRTQGTRMCVARSADFDSQVLRLEFPAQIDGAAGNHEPALPAIVDGFGELR
jgi:hypothetical protein